MANTDESYAINGLVQDEKTNQAIPGLRVEAWDWDLPLMIDDFVGETTTDSEGRFRIEFDTARFRDFPAVAPLIYFKRLFPQRHPDIYFKVFRKGESGPIKTTKDRILPNVRPGEHNVGVIEVDMAGTALPEVSEGPFSVEGIILQQGQPLAGVTVTAFDKDLRSEELLGTTKTGEQGQYKIRYSSDKFSRAEKGSADLFIRVHDQINRLLGESEIRFNAGEVESIDLIVGPVEEVELCEYEAYVDTLKPIIKDVVLATLTEQDLNFLTGETRIDRARLVWLQQSAQLFRTTKVPAEVFYGLAVLGIGVAEANALQLDLVLRQGMQSLREAIQRAAVKERLIPRRLAEPENLNPILDRLEQLKVEQGILKRYSIVGQLLFRSTKDPVTSYIVHAYDLDAEEARADLGYFFSDARGLFTASYIASATPAGESPSERRLRLEIANPQGEVVFTLEEVRVRPDLETPVEVLLPQPAGPDEIDLKNLVGQISVHLPRELSDYLDRHNIRSLQDIRQMGGLGGLSDLPVSSDHPAIRSLEAQANLSVLSTNFQQNQRLIAKGFTNLLTIARAPRVDFVSTVSGDIDEQEAYLLHVRARAQDGLLTNILTSLRADYANGRSVESGFGLGTFDQQPPEIIPDTCTCKDCRSAVSPGAYLADLLSYALKHLKNESVPITLDWLRDNFYQPFGELPVSCESSETQVRQVRLCVEVLRRHLRRHPPSKSLTTAEKAYCLDAYKALLSRIGTSYEELRLAQTASVEERQQLSDRLGITSADPTDPGEHLEELLLDPKAGATQQPHKALTESKLESLFGLAATKRVDGSLPDPLKPIKTPLVEQWRLAHLRQLWEQQDWPTDDAYGNDATLPVIDPDLIGPDDFRSPVSGPPAATAPSTAFDLWLQRRRWIDQQLDDLRSQKSHFGLRPIVEKELGSPILSWALLEKLGFLSYEGYSYLMTLLEKEQLAKADPNRNEDLSDLDWEDAISILTQARKSKRRIAWIEEESSLQESQLHDALLSPQHFWISQREPAEGAWPPMRLDDQPWIDPDEVSLDGLPEPTFGQPVIALWRSRRAELDQHVRTLKDKHKEPNSFSAMLSYSLELAPTDLSEEAFRRLREQLANNDETVAQAGKAQVEEQFLMSVEDFLRLAELRTKDAAGKPLSRAEWEAVYAILLSAIKQRTFPLWVKQENAARFYSEPWRALKVKLSRWRGSTADRQAWQQALRARSTTPIVDPDIVTRRHLQTPHQGETYTLWRKRDVWITNQLIALKHVSKDLAGLGTIVQNTLSPTGTTAIDPAVISLENLKVLWAGREAGDNIGPRLDQLNLTAAGLGQILRVAELLESDANVLESEWDAVYSILVQVEKERSFTDWHVAEQRADITLRPDLFKLPEPPALQFPPPEPVPLPEWRANWRDQRTWEDKLQTRIDQESTITEALKQAVSSTEEANLPTLRDALIDALPQRPGGVESNAKWVTDYLLIDAKTDCQLTTRVAQAIVTIQLLVWSVRMDRLAQAHPRLALHADDFDEEWKWLGSYESWRSVMFVYLYPENILTPSLRDDINISPPFVKLVSRLRAKPYFTPNQACDEAKRYFEYLKDICTLDLGASCQTRTTTSEGDRYLVHIFARGGFTGDVYWSTYDPEDLSNGSQSYWQALRGLDTTKVNRVFGAVPYEISEDERFLYVFMSTQSDGKENLAFIRYDLASYPDTQVQLNETDVPEGSERFKAVIVHTMLMDPDGYPRKVTELVPPMVVVTIPSVGVYVYQVSKDGQGWDQDSPRLLWEMGSSFRQWSAVLHRYTNIGEYIVQPNIQMVVHFPNWHITQFYLFALSKSNELCEICYREEDQPELKYHSEIASPVLFKGVIWALHRFVPQNEYPGHYYWFLEDGYGNDTVYAMQWGTTWIDFLRAYPGVFYGVSRIASNHGDVPDPYHQVFVYQSSDNLHRIYRASFRNGSTSAIDYIFDSLSHTHKMLHPVIKSKDDIFGMEFPLQFRQSIFDKFQHFRQLQIGIFDDNYNTTSTSMWVCIQEAFYFLQIQLALQLQKNGYYEDALEWFRTTYDFARHDNQGRKIYYGLVVEEKFGSLGERAENWLLDPLDPHKIATTRANAYTRFTVQSIIRCLLDYADAEFTRDTAESIARARTLYLSAQGLLALPDTQQSLGPCETLIVDLGVAVADAKQKDDVVGLQRALRDVSVRSMLESTLESVKETLRHDGPWEERIKKCYQTIGEARAIAPVVPTIADVLDDTVRITAQLQSSMLTQRWVVRAVGAVADAAASNAKSDVSLADSAGFGPHNYDHHPDYSGLEVPYSFCIPANPVVNALRLRAELNLYKLRTCRNIAGMKRQVEPYAASTDSTTGMPAIGGDGQLLVPGAVRLQPTPYRYNVLIERAKQLVQVAQQMETALLASLEKRDAEAYQLLKARQDIELSRAGVRLQVLRVAEAQDGVKLADLQRGRSQLQLTYYSNLLADQAIRELEQNTINYLTEAAGLYEELAGVADLERAGNVAGSAYSGAQSWGQAATATGNPFIVAGAAVAGGLLGAFGANADLERRSKQYQASVASTRSQIASTRLSQELTRREWSQQRCLAQQDWEIGTQQITIAQDHVRVVGQEQLIGEMQADHAQDTLEFLNYKFTGIELYDWMSNVLTGVYGYFLQQATVTAKLAENQLAFERQAAPPGYVQADYWAGLSEGGLNAENGTRDRRGLTGSARLLQDIYQLDQYAFDTRQRKLQLTKAISLSKLDPYSFQRFRQTGVLTFVTSQHLFDGDFPGHFLRLIRQVRTTVIALIPPMEGIHASLSTTGISRVTIGPDVFQTTIVRRDPEHVALTSPSNATGVFELEMQSELLLPFEGMGVDATWEFQLPKAGNLFDYRTIADVIVAIDYTALNSFAYRQQVIQELDRTVSADRPFSFRNQFADQWYDLHNPDQTANPMVVPFDTRREDFPPNIEDLKIQQVLLYLAGAGEDAASEISLTLEFTSSDANGKVGGSSTTSEGVISTRRSNGSPWLAIVGKSPVGNWELTFSDTPDVRELFEQERIEDILLVITYSGYTPEWPA